MKSLSLFAMLAIAACAPVANLMPGPSAHLAVPSAGHVLPQGLKLTTYTAGKTHGFHATAVPWDITAGPSRDMWFTDTATPAIGRISTDGRVKEFEAGLSSGSKPRSVVAGPDGNVWFSDSGTGAVGRITPAGAITEFRRGAWTAASAQGIVVGGDAAIWVMELIIRGGVETGSFLARVTTGGAVSRFSLPNLYADGSLAVDSNGELWFLAIKADKNNSIVLVQRRTDGSLVEHRTGLEAGAEPCCPNLAPKHLTIGADGNPWFTTLYFAPNNPNVQPNSLATFASGHFHFYHLNYPVFPSGIANDGVHLWVSGASVFQVKGALFLVRPDGKHKAYPLNSTPIGIAWNAPAVWFTSYDGLAGQIIAATVK